MAYASVAQTEHETLYNDSNAVGVASPTSPTSPELPEFSHRPLSFGFDGISGAVGVIDPSANDSNGAEEVGKTVKSLSSSSHSYEVVEDDDYEDDQVTPRRLNFDKSAQRQPPDQSAVNNAETTSEQPPVRTASVSRHLPLDHPTPDLQSLQGGYVRNLEESAERLSMTSSLNDEIHRMNSEMGRVERRTSGASSNYSRNGPPSRQFSTSSFSNSITGVNNTARNGGYFPSGFITSPTGSIRETPGAQNGSTHPHTARTSRLAPDSQDLVREGSPLAHGKGMSPDHDSHHPEDGAEGRQSIISASNGSRHRPDDPFSDFDGAHYSNRGSTDRASLRRISLQHPPLARDSKAYREAQPGETMIYYPAPVPVMLNLPTRLSKMNFGDREKRRLQALSGMPEEMRKSAAWLSNDNIGLPDQRKLASLPPQLRASAFFDQPSSAPTVQLKNGSAIQTLDSILDAAAHAPVSAFTDHPIAGRLGKEVYGLEKSSRKSTQLDREIKQKRRSSLSTMLNLKKSNGELGGNGHGRITSRESKALNQEDGMSGDDLDRETANSIAPGDDEIVETPVDGDEDDSDAESSESEHRPGFSGAPTTLLAELQMRKAAQKERNRTAANAFPNGMHSTLLEMDAVTQLQQKSRRTKHITLAWEDHDAAERENFDDEDVPLGVLYPEKDRVKHQNINRPIGLMEKKDMEDNEPLSQRRARLRGEPLQITRVAVAQSPKPEDDASKYQIDLGTELDEPEEETLGQRIKRMKEEKEKTTAGNFASDIASQLGLNAEETPPAVSKTPDIEETLGQRRQRLKEEAASRPQLQPRRSMADVLQANPVGGRQFSHESLKRPGQLPRYNTFGQGNIPTPQLPAHMAGLPYYNHAPYMDPAGNASAYALNGAGFPTPGYYGYNGGRAPMMQDPMMGPPLDPQQRAVIDRWREGIL